MSYIHFLPPDITIEAHDGETILAAASRAGLLVVAPCGGQGTCRKCQVLVDDEPQLACKYTPQHDITVELPPSQINHDASEKAASDFISPHMVDIACREPLLALDLGTTGVSALWLNPTDGAMRRGKATNRQSRFGADVLSRIMVAEDGGAEVGNQLRTLAQESLTEVASQIKGVSKVGRVALTANPTMVHLFLGWDASGIRRTPSSPLELAPQEMDARQVLGNWDILHDDARLHILPGAAGYLGGDVLAGVALMRQLYPEDRFQMLIDAGTNGEIVLWADGAVLAIATSAGPAFEGGEVAAGMAATVGAIDRVRILDEDLWAEYTTIGKATPRGICGSGTIELVAELLRQEALQRNGKLRPSTLAAVEDGEWGRSYTVVLADATTGGERIWLADEDISAVIRTKAAIFAGCRRLIAAMGMEFGELDRICVAGDFGYHINLDAAVGIGMLPDIARERYAFLGNASLAGGMMSLLMPQFAEAVSLLAQATTFLDLSEDMAFVDEFTAASFLPHTDLTLFPSLGHGK